MRIVNLAVLSLLTVAACESRPGADETGRAADRAMDPGMQSADTTITTDQTLDTTIVTEDTSVDVDTVTKEGDETVGEDTLQQ